MAKGRNLVLDGFAGSIGSLTVTPGENGTRILKAKITENNSNTSAQQKQRGNFKVAGMFAAAMAIDAVYIAAEAAARAAGKKFVSAYQLASTDKLKGAVCNGAYPHPITAGSVVLMFDAITLTDVEVQVDEYAGDPLVAALAGTPLTPVVSHDDAAAGSFLSQDANDNYIFDFLGFEGSITPDASTTHLSLVVTGINVPGTRVIINISELPVPKLTTFGEALSYLETKLQLS